MKNRSDEIGIHILRHFLYCHAGHDELIELTKILKCVSATPKEMLVWVIVQKLYARFQTPLGFLVKDPTLDQMCDKAAKRLKLGKLQGAGWLKLHCFSIKVFEHILNCLSREEREKLLEEMWNRLSEEQKKELKDKFQMANLSGFLHSSEVMVAHTMGIFLAREMALYTAGAIIRISLGTEVALAASTVLTRGATVFLGPIGWALMAMSVNDFMGANFKRVVPALLIINIVNMRVNKLDTDKLLGMVSEPNTRPETKKGCREWL